MFGIGFGEFTIVLVVLLLVVGPDRMPQLMRVLGKGIRQFRSAAKDLRSATGIDEIMREESLKELRALKGKNVGAMVRRELGKPGQFVRDEIQKPIDDAVKGVAGSTVAATNAAPRAGRSLSAAQLAAEQPPEGVDIARAAASSKKADREKADPGRAAPVKAEPGA